MKSTSQTKRKEKTQDGEEDTDEGHDESENGLTPTEDSAEGTQEEALTDAESAKKMVSKSIATPCKILNDGRSLVRSLL